jgi:hypothetical protein
LTSDAFDTWGLPCSFFYFFYFFVCRRSIFSEGYNKRQMLFWKEMKWQLNYRESTKATHFLYTCH